MARPTPLSGFPELLPQQRIVEQRVIDTLRETFELHGFAGIETRAVEPVDQLLRKGDTSKEVYLLRRLHEDSAEGHSGIGLHFDLTVPFARYVLENAGKLEFPFRRYQVQKVWRGERPQDGRYREFTQADIDVVGRDVLPFHHDVEVTRVMVDALSRLTGETTALYNAGFAAGRLSARAARRGDFSAPIMSRTAPAMVLWVDMFWPRAGDILSLKITAPHGQTVVERSSTVYKTQARRFVFAGKKRKARSLPPGTYRGDITLVRDKGGAKEKIISIVREVEVR